MMFPRLVLVLWLFAFPQHAILAAVPDFSSAPISSIPPIPYKQEDTTKGLDVRRLAAGALLCGLTLTAALYFLRKRLGLLKETRGGHLKILETQRLGPKSALHVIQFAGTVYLLAQNEHGFSKIASTFGQLDEPEEKS